MQNLKKNRSRFYLLIFIFIFPVIVSWLLFHFHDYFHFKTMNHGILINPPLDVSYLSADIKTTKLWRIVHVDNGSCNNQCEKTRYQLTQVVKALGKNYKRVFVTFLSGDSVQLQKLTLQNKDLTMNQVYLVDPLGNLFMYYPDTTNPMDILKDLKRVLEVSQIG